MRRLILLACVSTLIACVPDYDDPFYIHGRVLAEDGAASASEPLVLHSLDVPSMDATSSKSGDFTFEVPYLAMKPFRPGAGWFRLKRTPDGYASEHAIHFVTHGAHDFRLPDWRPLSIALVDEGNGAFRIPEDDDAAARYVLDLRSKSEVRWQWVVEPGATVQMTATMIEDAVAPHAVLRRLVSGDQETPQNLLGQGGSVAFVVEDASPAVDVAMSGAVSVSRLMPCDIDGRRQSACPFTDGRMDETQDSAREVVLFFNAPIRPRLVLLRAMDDAGSVIVVEGRDSASGEWWTLGKHDPRAETQRRRERLDGFANTLLYERFVKVELGASAPVTELRLRPEEDGYSAFHSLRELSVFE